MTRAKIFERRLNYFLKPHHLWKFNSDFTKMSTSHGWRLRLGKLRILSGQEVCAILVRHGFIEVRQRGSYIVMQKRLAD